MDGGANVRRLDTGARLEVTAAAITGGKGRGNQQAILLIRARRGDLPRLPTKRRCHTLTFLTLAYDDTLVVGVVNVRKGRVVREPENRNASTGGVDRFRVLFEQSLDAVYIGAPDGSVIDANQAWLDLFGYAREDLPSVNAIALYSNPNERADFLRRMTEDGFVKD